MADKKISELNSASLPLAGTEVLPIVQSGETKKITADDLKSDRLSNDIADYTTATLPLSDTDKLLVNQGGTFKEVAKSELGGGIDFPVDGKTYGAKDGAAVEIKNNLYKKWFNYYARTDAAGTYGEAINPLTISGTQSRLNSSVTGTGRINSIPLQNYLSATAVGSNCGLKNNNSSDGVIREGFDFYMVFGNNDANINCATTIGFYSLASAIPNLNITDFTTNFIGLGNDVGDSNLSFYAKRIAYVPESISANFLKIDCGSNFPQNDLNGRYLFRMEVPQTETHTEIFIKMTITNLINGATFSYTFNNTYVPALASALFLTINRSNRNTGVATNICFGRNTTIFNTF